MAYSNWGAFVYKNGERRVDKEDVGVFDTDEVAIQNSGMRIFINLLKTQKAGTADDWSKHSHHAVLGDNIVRLCGYKASPELWCIRNGITEQIVLPQAKEDNDDGELHNQSGEVKTDNKNWKWWFNQFDGNMLDLRLIEPDGSEWTSRCGYCYGAGWKEE